MDLVRTFETYCNANNIEFMYGSKSHLNLIERGQDLDNDKVHLLMFPIDRNYGTGSLNLRIDSSSYSGNFFLVKNSNIDQHYFNERKQDQSQSKYTQNIEPLVQKHIDIGNALLRCDYEIEIGLWKCIDAVDVLDANLDGIWCNYKITSK